MSLDERMRAGTRAAAGSQPIDTTAAWEEIQMQAQREHTRRNIVLVAAAAAAVVAGVVWGPGIVDSLSGQGNVAPVDSPTDEAVVDDGTNEEPAAEPSQGSPVQPGTYLYDNGPFPIGLTTATVTLDGSRGGDPYRIIQGDPYGVLSFDFPATAADLTRQVTGEESATQGREDEFLFYVGPIDFPTDIDAWLEGAVSLDVVDQGTLSRPDGDAAWWDLRVADPSVTCFAGDDTTDPPPCVALWPYVDDGTDHQIGMFVLGSARLYAIETDAGPLMALADMRGGPEDGLTDWLATTDEIVSSITLE
jgi:hypothetical protein